MQADCEAASVALLRKIVARKPKSAAAHLDLGMALAENYDLTGALAETGEAVRLAPGSALAHLNHGLVLFNLARIAEAQPDSNLPPASLHRLRSPTTFWQ